MILISYVTFLKKNGIANAQGDTNGTVSFRHRAWVEWKVKVGWDKW